MAKTILIALLVLFLHLFFVPPAQAANGGEIPSAGISFPPDSPDGYYLYFDNASAGMYDDYSQSPVAWHFITITCHNSLLYLGKDKPPDFMPKFTTVSPCSPYGPCTNDVIRYSGQNIYSNTYYSASCTFSMPLPEYWYRMHGTSSFTKWNFLYKGCLKDGFIPCLKGKLGNKFPFDFASAPKVLPGKICPRITFFEKEFDICFLYQFFRWMKYPVAVGLSIKLYLAL